MPRPPRCDGFVLVRYDPRGGREGWVEGEGDKGTYAGAVNAVALVAWGAFADDLAVRVGLFVAFDIAGS